MNVRRKAKAMPAVPTVLDEKNAFTPKQEPVVAATKTKKPAQYAGTDWSIGQKFSRPTLVAFLKENAPRWGGAWNLLSEFTDEQIAKSLGSAKTKGGAQGMCLSGLRLKEVHAAKKAA